MPAQSARRGPATPPAEETGEAPDVGLDDLLRLPTGYGAEMDRKGGATAPEWRARFEGARSQLADARKKLEQINAELDQMSGDSSAWSVAAPGSSDPQASPLSLRLRNEMKEQRGVIEQAERDLRALHVEADLAGVPDAWRE